MSLPYPYPSRSTRASRGADLASNGSVFPVGKPKKQRFLVDSASQPGTRYAVSLRYGHTCECPDHTRRQEDCKHIEAALAYQRLRPGPQITASVLMAALAEIEALITDYKAKLESIRG